jgi:lysophospholipase L1-like esterase
MRITTLSLLLLIFAGTLSFGQALQMLAPDKPENCAVRSQQMEKWLNDWSQLGRYREADADLPAPRPGENRVVFLGDSITDVWNLQKYFPGKPYVNRGISAQTTPNMLIRFRPDVVALKPKAVVILAGTNDIAGNTGPESLEEIENNLASMVDIARANHIAVILSSVLPVHNYTERSKRFFIERPMEQIRALNDWLKAYAGENHLVYVDYFSPMLDDKGLLKKDLAEDGLHPNDVGYKLMAELAEKAIQQALR